ncbi:MAG: hypothetical protein Q8O11_11150, partial [Syntrophales bacterium]|nr:hypothetical protein [Syntrophales bacterium]
LHFMTASGFDPQTRTHAFASVAEDAGPCRPFCWEVLPIYITMTDEEIEIIGMNSQIDLSRQIRQKDTVIEACLRRRRAIRPGSAIAQAHRM